MNIRSLLVAVSAMSTLALAACTVSTTGTSGSGGSTSSSTTSSGTAGGGTGGEGTGGENTGGAGGGGVGGGSGCDMALTCADVVTNGGAENLCSGTDAAKAYDDLSACTCTGACATDCGDNVCMGMTVSAACQTCVLDTQAGCGNEFQTCSNN